MTTKIGIVLRSFEIGENYPFLGLTPDTRKIGLPESRVLYTVLRSPHIDKKSREQFEMGIKKQFLVIKTETHELRKKFFWLKRQRILGAQYEIRLYCKTRSDQGKLQRLLRNQIPALTRRLNQNSKISALLENNNFLTRSVPAARPCSCGFLILVLDQAIDRDKMWETGEPFLYRAPPPMLLKCYFGPLMYEPRLFGMISLSGAFSYPSFSFFIREEVGRSSTSPFPSMSGIPVHAPV